MTTNKIIQILFPAMSARVLTAEQRKAFEEGLSALEGVPSARVFLRDSRRYRDYYRRVRQMIMYLQTTDTSGYAKAHSEKRRRGRPSKEERAEYAEKQKEKALKEAEDSLFPELKPEIHLQPLTYNGVVANPDGESIAATMPRLLELRPFLSAELQNRVNSVRELRNEMATKAEHAKTMAEANEKMVVTGKEVIYKECGIAELTERVVEIESHILPDIYKSVDREIGECYLRLSPKSGDPEYIAKIEKACSISPADLRTRFKPFYEKVMAADPGFADMVAERIAADRPEVKAARDAVAKHKAEADALIKYIMRKDKPNTEKRIKGLTERIEKLRRDYSDILTEEEINAYELILLKAKEDV